MVSKLYLPHNEPAAVSPAFDASWNITTGATRIRARAVPGWSASIATSTVAETSAAATNGLMDQFVSDAIQTAVTISGTVTMAFTGQASAASGAFGRIVVKVVSNNGSTVRGTLFSGLSSLAMITTGGQVATVLVTGTVTPVNALVGDRVVIERGARFTNTTTVSQSAVASRTDSFDRPDCSPVDGADASFAHNRPWVEFSQNNIWAPVARRVGGVASEVLIDNPRTPLRVGGVASEVLIGNPRAASRVGGVAVECLIPLDGQRLRTVHPVHDIERQVYVKVPGVGWRAVDPA